MKRMAAVGALVLTLVSASPAPAQGTEVALWGSFGQFGSQNLWDLDFEAELEFDEGIGFGVSANRFWSERFSTELFAMALATDAIFRVGLAEFPAEDVDLGSIDVTPVMLTGQYHFARGGRFDPYVGAGLAWVIVDDLDPFVTDDLEVERIEIDDELTFVVNAGVGITLTPRLGLSFDIRYLPLEPGARIEGEPADLELEMNPVILSAGLRFRFGRW